jgi:hypothetical protein
VTAAVDRRPAVQVFGPLSISKARRDYKLKRNVSKLRKTIKAYYNIVARVGRKA